jgi:hypothetical protein
MTRWYRAYEGTVTDAKLGEVALVAGCSRSVAIAAWHCILENCASTNEKGRFDMTPRRCAVILQEAIPTIEAVFAEFAALGLIENNTVCAWSKRQYESDNSTERSRRHRATSRNGDATLQGRCATPPETETETYTETEKKISVSAPRARSEGEDPPGFTEFWNAYPKRDGSPDRKGAVKAFKAALQRVSLDVIVEGAEQFTVAMRARGKFGTEYVPQARTWLNGDRWNERYEPSRALDDRQAENLAILAKYRA